MQLRKELEDFWFYLRRQVLLKIPTVSALTALFVAGWVSSTFTTSPVRAFMVRAGWIRGKRHYLHSDTYRVLSIALPLLAAAVTAYLIQRWLRQRRRTALVEDRMIVARRPHLLEEARRREAVLDEAFKLNLISATEYEAKCAALYAWYARDGGSGLTRAISTKLT